MSRVRRRSFSLKARRRARNRFLMAVRCFFRLIRILTRAECPLFRDFVRFISALLGGRRVAVRRRPGRRVVARSSSISSMSSMGVLRRCLRRNETRIGSTLLRNLIFELMSKTNGQRV